MRNPIDFNVDVVLFGSLCVQLGKVQASWEHVHFLARVDHFLDDFFGLLREPLVLAFSDSAEHLYSVAAVELQVELGVRAELQQDLKDGVQHLALRLVVL